MAIAKSVLLICLTFLAAAQAFAQFEVEPGDTTKKKVTVKDESSEPHITEWATETPNQVKFIFNPILSGEYLVSYERTFGNNFSAEAALGPTYTGPLYYWLNLDYALQEPIADIFGQAEASEPRTGYSLRLGGRYLFTGEDYPDSWFIGPEIRTRRYNQVLDLEKYASAPGKTALRQRYTEYYLLGGYQMELFHPVYFEYNLGFGLRKRKLEFVEFEFLPSGDKAPVLMSEEASYPFVTSALKIGIAF